MKKAAIKLTPAEKRLAQKLGRIGGQTRAANMTPERRKEVAHKAAKASAIARAKSKRS